MKTTRDDDDDDDDDDVKANHNHEDGDSMFHQAVDTYPPNYMAHDPRRP
jgi:hypothetical protein